MIHKNLITAERRPNIAVIGNASVDALSEKAKAANELGSLIIDRRWRLITGGLGGVMHEASKGARLSPSWKDGDIIGVLPGCDPSEANPYIDVIIPTGMDHLRNSIVSQSDAIIVIGGGAGTLSEMALAWVYHRLIIALPYEGWGEKLSGKKIDERIRYKDFPDDCVWPANSPLEAVDLVSTLLPIYNKRHKTIKQREVDK